MSGIFITVEGPDGAGKTSVLQALISMLAEAFSVEIVPTREPGGSMIAEEIREVILDPKNTAMDVRTEALLYAAGRRQHLVEKVLPAMAQGKIVICDRFVDSSIAYQGVGREIGVAEVAEINHFATDGLEPDLTLYLDIPSEVGLARIAQGKSERQFDRLDQEKLEFHQLVRQGYLDLYEANQQRMVLIDANQELAEVIQSCYQVIIARFPDLLK